MTRNKVLYSVRLFLTSLGASLLLVLTISYYFGDFSSPKIFEYMFWVGALILVAGGIFFTVNNPYQGASMAITTQLRHNAKREGLKRSNSDTTERYVTGMSIAAPGIIMMGVSFFVLA